MGEKDEVIKGTRADREDLADRQVQYTVGLLGNRIDCEAM